MSESAIEREWRVLLVRLRKNIQRRDRGVIVGCVLCFIPVFPVPVVGLLLSSANMWLLSRGQIARNEERVIKTSIVVGLFSFIISMAVAALLMWYWKSILRDAGATLSFMWGHLRWIAHTLGAASDTSNKTGLHAVAL